MSWQMQLMPFLLLLFREQDIPIYIRLGNLNIKQATVNLVWLAGLLHFHILNPSVYPHWLLPQLHLHSKGKSLNVRKPLCQQVGCDVSPPELGSSPVTLPKHPRCLPAAWMLERLRERTTLPTSTAHHAQNIHSKNTGTRQWQLHSTLAPTPGSSKSPTWLCFH